MRYEDLMERKKVLVLATLLMGAAIVGSLGFYQMNRLPKGIELNTKGLPTVGQGELEIVSFEDFRCSNCKHFHEELFPEIWAQYIASGKAHYTFVPVAFLNGSMPLANAALAVYKSSPERFWPFIGALFQEGDYREAAKRVGGIDLTYLEEAMQKRLFYAELERLLAWAHKIMGKDFGVPTVYVNGIVMPTGSFRAMQKRIERME